MNDAMFELTRFQLLSAALTPGPAERIDDAYVYAWDIGVYPLFHEWARLHQPFSEQFAVAEAPFRDLMTFLDDRWSKSETQSFYELERHYDTRGAGIWDRSALIHALRYTRLAGRFDAGFFAALCRPGDHPVEASVILESYERANELGFS